VVPARAPLEERLAVVVRERRRGLQALEAAEACASSAVDRVTIGRSAVQLRSIPAEEHGEEGERQTFRSRNSDRQVVVVCNRFKERLLFWETVLGVVRGSFLWRVAAFGYRLPFGSVLPPWRRVGNNASAVAAAGFVSAEIAALAAGGYVVAVDDDEVWVVNPLTVSTNDMGRKD
jgi:hypothetical protein